MTTLERALTIETRYGGPVRATTEFDPADGRYTLHLSGSDLVRGTLSVHPDIREGDGCEENDARSAAETLEPVLRLKTYLHDHRDASALVIFDERQVAPHIMRERMADLDEFVTLTAHDLYALPGEPHGSIYLALLLALVQAVDSDPRRATIRQRWQDAQKGLAVARWQQALTEVKEQLRDYGALKETLLRQIAAPFTAIASGTER